MIYFTNKKKMDFFQKAINNQISYINLLIKSYELVIINLILLK